MRVDIYSVVLNPITIWLLRSDLLFKLPVSHYLTGFEVHGEHLAWSKSSLLLNSRLFNFIWADLWSEIDHAIVGDLVSCRTKSISIKTSAENVSIAEGDVSWSIPWLLHTCVVLVEVSNLLSSFKWWMIFECLRNQKHECFLWWVPIFDIKFNHIIQRSWITTENTTDWYNIIHDVIKLVWLVLSITCSSPVHVTQECINFTIMANGTEWLC